MEKVREACVLVVEDNLDNMYVEVELLHNAVGIYFVDSAITGFALFNLLDRRPTLTPDLILLDIEIPGENGYRVLERIRRHPRLSTTRVVAVTGKIGPEDIDRAREAGFDGFIGKPIMAEVFPEQIRRILAGEPVWEPR